MTKHLPVTHEHIHGPPAVLRETRKKTRQKNRNKHTVAQTTETLEIGWLGPAPANSSHSGAQAFNLTNLSMLEWLDLVELIIKKWLAYRWDMKYTDNISRLLAPDSLSVISPYDRTEL